MSICQAGPGMPGNASNVGVSIEPVKTESPVTGSSTDSAKVSASSFIVTEASTPRMLPFE